MPKSRTRRGAASARGSRRQVLGVEMDGQFHRQVESENPLAQSRRHGFKGSGRSCDYERRHHLVRAWAAARRLDAEAFFGALSRAEEMSQDATAPPDPRWRQELSVLQAIGHVWRDDARSAEAVAMAIPGRGRHRAILQTVRGYAAWQQHNLAQFHEAARFQRLRASGPLAIVHLLHLSMQAAAEAEQLRFKHAERLAKAAQKLVDAEGHGPLYLLPTCVLASVAYESGEVDEADLLIRGRMASVERAGAAESAILGFVVSARLAADRGNQNVAMMLLSQGERLAFQRGWLRLAVRCASERVLLLLDRNDVQGATAAEASITQVLEHSTLRFSDPAFDAWPIEVARCRVLIETGQAVRAAVIAGAMRNVARSRGQQWVSVRLTVLLAGALMKAGDWATGVAELTAALEAGAGAGLFRTFVDEIQLIAAGLQRLRADPLVYRGHLASYVDGLLRYEKPRHDIPRKKRIPAAGHVDPLTDREIVVLRLMSLGLTNKEIARALDIMPETIKSHAKRIFVKLSAKARTEAVYRANELGIM
jgi:ATP/maltotriose-dependent transcriptional regulator MalT